MHMTCLTNVKMAGAAFAVAAFMAFFAGCGSSDEVEELRKEVSQLKAEVRDLRRSIGHRVPGKMESRFVREEERIRHHQASGTNGVNRTWSGRVRPSREEMEARRKMMQDPEMRKKFEAEQKARMEERRRQHEERRREMEARRRNGKGAVPPAPGGQPKANGQ